MSDEPVFTETLDLESREGIQRAHTLVAEAFRMRRLTASEARVWTGLLKQAGDALPGAVKPTPVKPTKKGRKDVEDLPGNGPGPGVTAGGPMSVLRPKTTPQNPWGEDE